MNLIKTQVHISPQKFKETIWHMFILNSIHPKMRHSGDSYGDSIKTLCCINTTNKKYI